MRLDDRQLLPSPERNARATHHLVLMNKRVFSSLLVMLVLTAIFTVLSLFVYTKPALD